MEWGKRVLRRLTATGRIDEIECEVKAELLFHVEMRTRDNIESGIAPEDARTQALERFGDLDRLSNDCRMIRRQAYYSRLSRTTTLFSLVMAALGLAISLLDAPLQTQQVGRLLVAIAVLLRLFVYLKRTTVLRSEEALSDNGRRSKLIT
jgi:hypothetical protein